MKKASVCLLAFLIVLLALSALPTKVYAIANPDTPPQVSGVYMFTNCKETGDIGILVDYYLDYGTLPSETATDSYLVSFVDTDGTTQLRSASPYTFVDSGYGRGMVWIYFSAADVITYSIDYVDMGLYRVWLVGNPTVPSGWPGVPPKTVATIDYWQTTGDTPVLVALKVLYFADALELIWSLDMIQTTPLGSKLTTLGESYFENVIADLRTIAPACFAAGTYDPDDQELDFTTSFGAIAQSSGGTIVPSPMTLVAGINDCNITGAGTIILTLNSGTTGHADTDVGVVVGSPVTLNPGTNTITVGPGVGNIHVTVNLTDTAGRAADTIIGTGFDLTTLATKFGMSRMWMSSIVWILVSILICASVYKVANKTDYSGYQGGAGGGMSAGKITLLVFDLCIVGGAVLGMLSMLVAVLMFLAFGVFIGYIIFFRGANV